MLTWWTPMSSTMILVRRKRAPSTHRQFPEIGVQLSGESQTGGDAGHGQRDQMIEVAVGGRGQLECPEADVVESLVVNAERLVRVLDQLMHGEGRVVRLDHGVGDLGHSHRTSLRTRA
jgi:hypothetical protein